MYSFFLRIYLFEIDSKRWRERGERDGERECAHKKGVGVAGEEEAGSPLSGSPTGHWVPGSLSH